MKQQRLSAQAFLEVHKQKLITWSQKITQSGTVPSLRVILTTEDLPSQTYVRHKQRFAKEVGVDCQILTFDHSLTPEVMRERVRELNNDSSVHGIIIQLPLNESLKGLDPCTLVAPEKDVDGFHPLNQYRVYAGQSSSRDLVPCTPKGILSLLNHYQVELEGKNVVIVGRSLIVGRPLGALMTQHNATVTLCHSKTLNLRAQCQRADILVSAIGIQSFFDKSFLNEKNPPILVDVGIHRNPEGKLCGDMDLKSMAPYSKAFTPVPGGVGPLTVYSLLENTLIASANQQGVSLDS